MTDDRMTMDARAEAVEVMAQASWEAEGKGGRIVPWPGRSEEAETVIYYDDAEAMLDALLSSGLAVLMGSLEQVGWAVPCSTDSDNLYQWALRATRWEDGDPTWEPVFRLRREEEGT